MHFLLLTTIALALLRTVAGEPSANDPCEDLVNQMTGDTISLVQTVSAAGRRLDTQAWVSSGMCKLQPPE